MTTPMDLLKQELEKQVALEDRVAVLESDLKVAKARLHKQNTEHTPTAMAAAEVTGYTMDNGFEVKKKPFVMGSIDKESPEAAYADIERCGEASIIKRTITLPFGKDETEKAEKAQKLLEDANYEPNVSMGVHHTTLKTFLGRHYKDEGFELQKIYDGAAGMKAIIKRPKR